MNTVIKEVTTKKELKRFIAFPDKLFKNNPHYIPPLHRDEAHHFSAATNPAYQYCAVKLWLAYQNGKIVGRVCGIVNHTANTKWNEHKVRFGWFDFIPDMEVCRLLLQTVAEFGKTHQAVTMHGPMGFTNMNKECWVIDNFETHQNITTLYNPPYYIDFLQKLGFQIDCEWQQYRIEINQPCPEEILHLNKIVSEKYHLRILQVSQQKKILPYALSFFHTLNASFNDIYGFIPLSDAEIDIEVRAYFSFIDLKFVKFVVNERDEVVGFGLALPDIGRAFQKANGSLFPFGWFPILRAMKHFDNLDLLLIGVHPDWHNRGVHALILHDMQVSGMASHCQYAYTNPQIAHFEAIKMWNRHYDHVTPTCRRAIFQIPIQEL